MYLENLVFDAVDPQRLGRFWEAVVGGERLTDEPEGFETRLTIEGGPVLDLCFQRVPEPPPGSPRLHLDLLGGARQTQEVERLLGLGARHLDIGQRDVPWVVLADPEGNPCCVMEDRAAYAGTGPIAALPLLLVSRFTRFEFGAISWFGIRGIGSIYYLMFAIDKGLPYDLAATFTSLIFTIIGVSIVVHGVSMTPLLNYYSRLKRPRGAGRADRRT